MRRLRCGVRAAYERVMAVCLLMLIEVSLRRTTLPDTCRRLRVTLDLDGGEAGDVVPTGGVAARLPRWALPRVRAARLVAARWPAGDTCLRRCLLLGHRLRRLDPVLRIGVRRDASGRFGAHSWLEVAGMPLDVDRAEFAALRKPGR